MDDAPQLGHVLSGKYRVLRELGRGGMGAVYAAENIATGRRVALKWLHPHMLSDSTASERLVREARAAARIRHPNVVDIYDIDRHGDSIFLIMEYLEGESLASFLERGEGSIARTLQLIHAAMGGVAAAHRSGVVHRDIKPDNIFLAREGEHQLTPKVLDFGISKLMRPDASELALTKTGAFFGTPLYMSLEQMAGKKDIDERTDVYSFGVLLYEALTARLPHEGHTFTALLGKLLSSEPLDPRVHRPELPEALAATILRALRRDREARTASVEQLMAELAPFLENKQLKRSSVSRAPLARSAKREAQTQAPHGGKSSGRALHTWWVAGAALTSSVALAIGVLWPAPPRELVLPEPEPPPVSVGAQQAAQAARDPAPPQGGRLETVHEAGTAEPAPEPASRISLSASAEAGRSASADAGVRPARQPVAPTVRVAPGPKPASVKPAAPKTPPPPAPAPVVDPVRRRAKVPALEDF